MQRPACPHRSHHVGQRGVHDRGSPGGGTWEVLVLQRHKDKPCKDVPSKKQRLRSRAGDGNVLGTLWVCCVNQTPFLAEGDGEEREYIIRCN